MNDPYSMSLICTLFSNHKEVVLTDKVEIHRNRMWWQTIPISLFLFLMMTGCVKTDVLVVKPCEKKEKAEREEKIVLLLGEDNQSQTVTVTQVGYPREEGFGKEPCQIRINQTCMLGLGCFKD